MTTYPGQTITPPPSIDDILAKSTTDERIGRIDFTAPLVTDEEGTPVEPEALTTPAARPVRRPSPRPAPVVETEPVVVETEPVVVEIKPVAVEAEPVAVEIKPVDVSLAALPPADSLAKELPHLAVSVEEIAATVIDRMQRAGDAHVRLLEAVELETARRCELVTAQAELDAELIRLHARREAHAIITAARMRTGGDAGSAAEGQLLGEISASFSRFAESIETSAAEASMAHDPSSPS
ncbi:hypothetical protein NPS01_23610 [Nocardioides psychrotolerans]|uniref:Uncharacterized protein n=1 Tax=Nocardioides psychrotolerans TaxID=1005945 RepID=A0A1I3HWV9_9ACTN|nr:hypothetical protein [Nocardioides psychrotolerans]GEP38698.1 hypothetical protein NPS01_23610 [Nocardioides psychrotolerans]SFI40205.1 hypothetical protein SAMN05216561_10821 [Nocardioides psychrotolerans]